jgi:sugar phosphate permease
MENNPSQRSGHRWTVFGLVCLVYFFVYFHRVSTSVIVPDLLSAFHTNATALGVMSSMYFYLYALEQPLVGILTDRLGARRVIGYWSLAAAAGCFLFGLAPNIGWASAGRALIGIGVGGVYVPAVKALSLWFRKSEFATMLGLLMSVGNLGAVIATTPLAWMAGTWGWRTTFFIIGAVTMVLAGATLALTRDHTGSGDAAGREREPETTPGTGARGNIRAVLISGRFWTVALIFFGIYGTLVTFQGLWATPFLMAALGMGQIGASKVNMVIPLGVIIGAPLFGSLGDRLSMDRANTLTAIVGVYALTWVGTIWCYPLLGLRGLSLVMLVMGITTGGFISTLWGIVRETTPSSILGLTSGLLNVAPFLGCAAFQVITGAILDRAGHTGTGYSLPGFETAFIACLAGILVCFGLCLLLRRNQGKITA